MDSNKWAAVWTVCGMGLVLALIGWRTIRGLLDEVDLFGCVPDEEAEAAAAVEPQLRDQAVGK